MDPVGVGLEHPQEEKRVDPPRLHGRPSGLGASAAPPVLLPLLLPSPFVSRFSLSLSPSSFLCPDRSREQHQSHHVAAHGGPSVDPFTADVHVDLVTSCAAASHVQSGAAMCEARTVADASSLTLVHANVGQPTPMPPTGPDPMRPADGQRGSGQWWSHRSRRWPM